MTRLRRVIISAHGPPVTDTLRAMRGHGTANIMAEAAGELCRVLLPIREHHYSGNPCSATAVCTLSSMGLLRRLAGSDAMSRIAVAGRLLSENRGIDQMIRYLYANRGITTVVLCGMDSRGHRAGDALLRLYENGTDHAGRIIGSTSPDPFLAAPRYQIRHYMERITVVNLIGRTSYEEVLSAIP